MDTKLTGKTRIESDLIGAREIPAEALYGGFPSGSNGDRRSRGYAGGYRA